MISDIMKIIVVLALAGFLDPFVQAEISQFRNGKMAYFRRTTCSEKYPVSKEFIESLPTMTRVPYDLVIEDWVRCVMRELRIIKGHTINLKRAEKVATWGSTDLKRREEIRVLLMNLDQYQKRCIAKGGMCSRFVTLHMTMPKLLGLGYGEA